MKLRIKLIICVFVISIIISFLFNKFTGIYLSDGYLSNLFLPVIDLFFTFLLIIILSKNKYLFWIIFVPYSVFIFLYAPTAVKYGYVNFYYLYSLFATNGAESLEFIKAISLFTWIQDILFIVLVFLNRYMIVRYDLFNIRRTIIIFGIAYFLLFGYKKLIDPTFPSPIILKTPKEVVVNCYKLYKDVHMLRYLEKEDTDWVVDSVKSEYKNYILIIGESVRRDFMGCYGFPYQNTPFMSRNGTLLEGLTSAGFNTISSLRYMLTNTAIDDDVPNYKENFIDLANKAGFETIWISNQGTIGEYDTPVAFIARRSIKNIFLKNGKYDIFNFSDFDLVSKFEAEYNIITPQSRLFIIHLMGSHPNASERIEDYPRVISFPEDDGIECYINSIHKSDSLVEKVYDISKKEYARDSKETFSLIYFSDHGLKYYSKNEVNLTGGKVSKTGFFVNEEIKEVYEIPLFRITSNDSTKRYIQAKKYGKNFTRGLAYWMGIKSTQIKNELDLFSSEDDIIIDKSLRLDEKKNETFNVILSSAAENLN